jgi:ankyrin repeat protein
MTKPLPAQPSLRQLQIQSKELAKALKKSQPDALDRLRKSHPHFIRLAEDKIPDAPLQLHDAQWVIAREHGFESWPKLKAQIDRVSLRRLVDAVEKGDIDLARSLLRQNPGLVHMDMAENDEHRVLHYAVLRRDEPMVRLLMEAGADAHKGIFPHRDATTALVLATERGFNEIVKALEEEEQSRREEMSCPNATISPEQDQLGEKIRQNDYTAALSILHADPKLAKACDRDGGTPLHVACEEGALPVIDWLLEHHVSPRKKNLKGWSPLESAVLRVGWKERGRGASFPEIAQRLLHSGAEMTPLVAAALGDLKELKKHHRRDPKGMNEIHFLHRGGPLSVAVTFGKLEALKLLLDLGLDVNERHRLPGLEEEVISSGQPLWLAAGFGEYEMARILLEHGADPSAEVYASGSPVHRAYGLRDERMKKLLADHGGHPTPNCIGSYRDVSAAKALLERASSEKTVEDLLWGSAFGGAPEIVKMCLEKLHWSSNDPRWLKLLVTPLALGNHAPHSEHPELFDRSTYPECLRLMLRHGVNVNITDRRGATLMHGIVAAGKMWNQEVMTDTERLQFARIALDALPNLTIRDDLLKSTPLGWACRWGREDLVRLFLEHGASVHEPEAEPWATPLAWATKRGHPAIASLLRAHGSAT